jgi:quinol monooxygenase YgiN
VAGEPGQRIFYELYRDEEAFRVHEEQPHVRAFLAERAAYVESFAVDFITPLAGKTPRGATTGV